MINQMHYQNLLKKVELPINHFIKHIFTSILPYDTISTMLMQARLWFMGANSLTRA